MPSYRLIYFPFRGRGEAIRLLFAHADVDYHDDRIDRADWPAIKDQMPLKQMPVLEIDGKVKVAQSTAILRYLAHEFGMKAKTPLDEAKVDMLGEGIHDAFVQCRPWRVIVLGFIEGDKEAAYKEVVPPVINNYGAIFERILTENGTGWLVGDSITWVDFLVAEVFHQLITFGDPTALDAFPHVKKHIRDIYELPNVKKYVERRPKNTPF